MITRYSNILPIVYAQKKYTDKGYQFTPRLQWCLENGFVISVPYLFAMGHFYKEDDKIICYIECCCGDMKHLLDVGINIMLDFVEFQRNFNGKIKRYSFEKLIRRIK